MVIVVVALILNNTTRQRLAKLWLQVTGIILRETAYHWDALDDLECNDAGVIMWLCRKHPRGKVGLCCRRAVIKQTALSRTAVSQRSQPELIVFSRRLITAESPGHSQLHATHTWHAQKQFRLIDWLSCAFTSHSTQNRSFWKCSHANLLAWYGKTKPNATKAYIHQSKEMC